MRKCGIFLFFAVLLFILSSCTSNKLKGFAIEFAEAVKVGDSTTVLKMYPSSNLAEKLEIAISEDSFSVEEKADTFILSLGNNKSLSILKVEDDNTEFRIVDSHNIFVYPKERMNFAYKTGWINVEMSDIKIAERFSDTIFVNYLAKMNLAQLQSLFRLKGINFDKTITTPVPNYGPWYIYYPFVVENNTEFDISGEDYYLSCYQAPDRWRVEGVDIKHGEKKDILVKSHAEEAEPTGKIYFNISGFDILSKYFTPKGNEYEQYIKSPVFRGEKD